MSGADVAADQLRPGDVIAYGDGGRMVITDPGLPRRAGYMPSSRLVLHGLITQCPATGGPWRVDMPVEVISTPRCRWRVFGQREQRGPCPCRSCSSRRERRAAGQAAAMARAIEAGIVTAEQAERDLVHAALAQSRQPGTRT